MLDGEEQGFAVRGEAGAAEFGADGDAEEMPARAAAFAIGLEGPEAVGGAGIIIAVGGDPEAALGVDRAIVGAGQPAVFRGEGIPGSADFGDGGVAAAHEDFPGRGFGGEVAAGFGDLDDVAETVGMAGIGGVFLAGLAAVVVGEHDIDAPRARVGLDVFRAVHGRGAEEIAGAAGFDDNVRLRMKSVGGRERARAEDEGEPGDGAVVVEARDVERAVIQQVGVGIGLAGDVAARRDELVDIVEALVVAAIDDDAAIRGDDAFGALVLEAAEGGAFLRG